MPCCRSSRLSSPISPPNTAVRFGAAHAALSGVTTGTGTGVAQVANVVATETKGDAAPKNAEAVGAGKEIFNGTCAHCHGPDAVQSEKKIDLRLLRHRYGDDVHATYLKTVHEGRPAKGMPSWKEVFTDDQLENVYAFLMTVQVESND